MNETCFSSYPRVMCSSAVLNTLLRSADTNIEDYPHIPVFLEIADMPYTFVLTPVNDEFRTVFREHIEQMEAQSGETVTRICVGCDRMSVGMDPQRLRLVWLVSESGGTGFVTDEDHFDREQGILFVKACYAAAEYLYEHNLEEVYASLNRDREVLLLETDGESVSCAAVSGMQRPSLMAVPIDWMTSEAANNVFVRPYRDERDEAERIQHLSPAELEAEAEQGNEVCCAMVSDLYLYKEEKDFAKAFAFARKGGELGNAECMYKTGLMYAKGCGTERDFAEAVQWLAAALESGCSEALECLAYLKSVENAEEGQPASMGQMALLYMYLSDVLTEYGSEEDYAEMFRWVQMGLEQNEPQSQYVMGLACQNGKGIETNLQKACEYYRLAAMQGYPGALVNLGLCILKEECSGTPEEAFLLLQSAAELGDATAMQAVGECYQYGKGTEQDNEQAIAWYERSLQTMPNQQLEMKVQVLKMMNTLAADEESDDSGDDDMELELEF